MDKGQNGQRTLLCPESQTLIYRQLTPLYGHWLSAHCENLNENPRMTRQSRALSNIQSTWQSPKLKASVQSKVTAFFK